MSRRIRNGLVTFLTVATSVLMFGGAIVPDQAEASVGFTSRWPSTPQIVTTTSSANAKVYPGADQNRLMLIAVACEYTGSGGVQTITVNFGGVTPTLIATNSTNNSTIWLGYLKESQIAAATSHVLTVSQSHTTRTLSAMYATSAVFSGVDQTTPVGTGLTATTAGAATLSLTNLTRYGLTGNTGLSVYLTNWDGQTSTPYTGYREVLDYAGTSFNLASSYKETTAGTEATITSTALASTIGAMVGVGINPATNVSTNTTCAACHGYPPVDAVGRNVIQGAFSGSHAKHSGTELGQAGLVCSKCHYNHTSNAHQSGFKNLTGSALPGNAYSTGKKVAVTNVSGAGTCTTVYCHSNGRSNVATRKYVPAASTKWGGPATTCINCHGGRAGATTINSVGSTAGFRLSSSHSQHLKYPAANINCQMCHSMTSITDARTLRPYSSQARHANGVVDVTFTDIVYGTYTAYKSPTSGSAGTTKKCGNVSCHGGTTRTGWSEGPVTTTNSCVHCHGNPSYTGVGNTTSNRKNFAPGWAGTGTSTDGRSNADDIRVGAHFSHLSSAHMAMLKCTECHTVPDIPFSGTHMALPRYNSQTLTFLQASSATRNSVQVSYTSGTSVKAATCSTVYCHGAKMRNGDTSGSYRKPSWNMELTTSNPADGYTCGRCHGFPPSTGTTTELHNGKVLADCTTCHTTVVDVTGKIKNKALHMDGKLQAPGSPCNGCHSAKSSDTYFVSASAHKFHVYTSIKWASDYQLATETELYKRTSESPNIPDTYKFKCGVCHDSTQTRPSYASHMDSVFVAPGQTAQVYFGYYTTAGKTTGYVADVATAPASPDTKGSRTWTAGSTTPGTSCMTTYCHSNGLDGANFVSGTPVSWATATRTATPARCSLCHGGARGSANPMNTGKHNRHMNNWTTQGASLQKCTACHAGTVSNNTVILPASVRHVNKQKNYSGIYSGDNYDPATKTCSAFYCHSDSKGRYVNPGTWTAGQGPKNCDGCHGRSADGSQTASNNIGYPNYTSTGKAAFRANSHPKHVAQLGITDTRGCAKCHRSTIDRNFANRQHPLSSNHLDGNTNYDIKPDRTEGISFTYATATKTCSSASCHKSGRLDKTLFANVQWGDTGNCRMCHGGRASAMGGYSASRSGFNLSTTHKQHLKYPATEINCNTCHYKTAADAASFKPYSGPLKHNNNKREVRLSPLLPYASYTAFKSWSSSERATVRNDKTCANTSCHGGTTRNAWQKATYNGNNTCVHCHGVAVVSAALGNTKASRKFFAPGWAGTGISTDGISSTQNIRVGSHFKHLSSVYMKTRNCNECHTVPDEPFSGNHMQALRFNSQTLNFNQSSSATIVIGVGSGSPVVMASGAFTGYTSGTSVKAATCSSVYCHGNRMKTGDTSGSYRKPYWNYSNMINYSVPNTACGRCHGNPPTAGTAAATHTDYVSQPTTSCSGCHGNVVNSAGKIINKDLHINGIVNASSDCIGCHAIASTDFVKASRHVTNGTTTNIVTAYDCIVCHAEGVAQATGVTRSDLHSGTGATTGVVDLRNVDNVSQLTTGGTSGTNYFPWPHRRANAALAKGAANTTNRNNMDTFCMNCHDSNGASGIAVNNSNSGLILSGLNTTVRSVTTAMGGTNSNPNNATVAQRPFNTEDNLQNVNDKALSGNGTNTIGTFRTATYGRVVNVKGQFNSGNLSGTAWASHHNLNQFTKRYTSNSTVAGTGGIQAGAWTGYVTKESVTMNSATGGTLAGLHCSDCHLNEVNAHGSTNAWYMLMNVGTVAPFNETADVAPTLAGATSAAHVMTCNLCHANAAHTSSGSVLTASHYPHNPRCNNVDVITGTAIEAPFGNNCHACHGGFGNTADATNKDPIGTGTVTVGRGSLGAIHGNNESYNPANGATASKRYRFMSGATMRFYNPNGTGAAYTGTANWEGTTAAGCYTIGSGAEDTWAGGCTSHSGGGTGQTMNSGRKLTY